MQCVNRNESHECRALKRVRRKLQTSVSNSNSFEHHTLTHTNQAHTVTCARTHAPRPKARTAEFEIEQRNVHVFCFEFAQYAQHQGIESPSSSQHNFHFAQFHIQKGHIASAPFCDHRACCVLQAVSKHEHLHSGVVLVQHQHSALRINSYSVRLVKPTSSPAAFLTKRRDECAV